MDLDSYAKIIKRQVLTDLGLTRLFVSLARKDRAALEVLLPAATPEDLDWVYDTLTIYPKTDFGWGVLPTTRKQFERPDLTFAEAAELEHGFYQEDRPHVEYLRRRIKPSREPS
jgi:hypothetical protein